MILIEQFTMYLTQDKHGFKDALIIIYLIFSTIMVSETLRSCGNKLNGGLGI